MSWVQQVHAKAHILQGQIETLRKMASVTGADPEAVTAQLYVQIEELYSTEFPLARAMDESDLVFHMEGSALRDHTPRLSLIESIFANIRQQVFKVANAVAELGDRASISDRDVELSLSALAPGSLYIGIKAEPPEDRFGQPNLFGDSDEIVRATREAMRSIGVVSQHLDDGEDLRKEVPDAKVRDAALIAVANIAPTGRKGIQKVTISSAASDKQSVSAELTPIVRAELRRQLRKEPQVSVASAYLELEGEVRELDLDFRRFELRRIPGRSTDTSVRCILSPASKVKLATLAGMRVRVRGSGESNLQMLPRLIQVDDVEVLRSLELPSTGDLLAALTIQTPRLKKPD